MLWRCADLFTLHPDLFTLRPDLFTLRPDLFTLRSDLFTLRPDLFTLRPDFCSLHLWWSVHLSTGANTRLAHLVVATGCTLRWWYFYIQLLMQGLHLHTWWLSPSATCAGGAIYVYRLVAKPVQYCASGGALAQYRKMPRGFASIIEGLPSPVGVMANQNYMKG